MYVWIENWCVLVHHGVTFVENCYINSMSMAWLWGVEWNMWSVVLRVHNRFVGVLRNTIDFLCNNEEFNTLSYIRNPLWHLMIVCICLKGLNLCCFIDLRFVMARIQIGTIWKINQEPQDLQSWCLMFDI